MDKIIALLVTIVAVVAVATIVIFAGINPSVNDRADETLTQMNTLPFDSID